MGSGWQVAELCPADAEMVLGEVPSIGMNSATVGIFAGNVDGETWQKAAP